MAIEELQNGRYRYLRMLGSGGMGEVYLMQDARVSRQVAIKVLHGEGTQYPGDEKAGNSARLFEREARAIAALDHPNILPLYDFGEEVREDLNMTYMVMPYCADGSLEGWLRQRGGALLTPPQVAPLIEQAAEALQYAHEHEMIHLDVKPPNFLIRSNRKEPLKPTLLLADFGIARNFTTVSSSSRTIRGTPAAMSPEQWSGEPAFASDQYALAVMAYEMLVGRPPFTGSLEQLMYRHFSVQPPPPSNFNPRLPAAVDEVLLRALSKKPEERFPSIVDFATALTEAANQPPTYSENERAIHGTLLLSQAEAEAGISRMITLAGGEEITVAVPPGAQDGQVLLLPGEASTDKSAGVVLVNLEIQRTETRRSSGAVRDGQSPETPVVTPVLEAQTEPKLPPQKLPPEKAPLQRVALSASSPISTSEHNSPTLAGVDSEQQITVAPRPVQPRRRFGLVALISLLIVLVLVAGSILVYMFVNHSSSASANQPTPTHAAQTQATLTPTPTPAPPTPTVAPGLYIAGTYNGSLTANSGSSMSLSVKLIQTNGSGALTGSATFNSATHYPLHGTVDKKGNFTFIVQQSGQTPYVFYGAVQSQVNLHGNYCRSATAPCLADDGYFTVGPRS